MLLNLIDLIVTMSITLSLSSSDPFHASLSPWHALWIGFGFPLCLSCVLYPWTSCCIYVKVVRFSTTGTYCAIGWVSPWFVTYATVVPFSYCLCNFFAWRASCFIHFLGVFEIFVMSDSLVCCTVARITFYNLWASTFCKCQDLLTCILTCLSNCMIFNYLRCQCFSLYAINKLLF